MHSRRFLVLAALLATSAQPLNAQAYPQVVTAGSAFLQGATGLGTGEMVCPHSSARALGRYVSSDKLEASRIAKSVYRDPSGQDWAYVRVGVASIPTLDPIDGSTLDYIHPADATLLLYPEKSGSVDKTFWAHRFNKGEVVHASNRLTDEGVDDLRSISASISKKRFLLAEFSEFKVKHDFLWTNTILMHSSDRPKSLDWSRFEQINNQFLSSLPPKDIARLPSSNVIFITCAKNSGGDEMITVFPLGTREIKSSGHLIGQMHTLTNDASHRRDILVGQFSSLKPGGRVYLYGDNLSSINIAELAELRGLEVIRRGPTITKSILQTEGELVKLSNRPLAKDTTTVLNGVPGTVDELEAMGKPSGGESLWAGFKRELDAKLDGHYNTRLTTKAELAEELTVGTNDVLFLIAHFDNDALYFGKENISIKEIEALADRVAPNDPRIAILIVCNAGRINPAKKIFFRKQLKSVGETFIRKGFFQKIVGPDHEIESAESLKVLTQYLRDARTTEKGWIVLADNKGGNPNK